jgi:hypothetical protein
MDSTEALRYAAISADSPNLHHPPVNGKNWFSKERQMDMSIDTMTNSITTVDLFRLRSWNLHSIQRDIPKRANYGLRKSSVVPSAVRTSSTEYSQTPPASFFAFTTRVPFPFGPESGMLKSASPPPFSILTFP